MSVKSKQAEEKLKNLAIEIGENSLKMEEYRKQIKAYNIICREYRPLIEKFCSLEEGSRKRKLYEKIYDKARKEHVYAESFEQAEKEASRNEKGFCLSHNYSRQPDRIFIMVRGFLGFNSIMCVHDASEIKRTFDKFKPYQKLENAKKKEKELEKLYTEQKRIVEEFFDATDYADIERLNQFEKISVEEIKDILGKDYKKARSLTFSLPTPIKYDKETRFNHEEVAGLIKTMSALFLVCQENQIPLFITYKEGEFWYPKTDTLIKM